MYFGEILCCPLSYLILAFVIEKEDEYGEKCDLYFIRIEINTSNTQQILFFTQQNRKFHLTQVNGFRSICPIALPKFSDFLN